MPDYLKEIYDQYPPNDEHLLISTFWPEYAGFFVEEYKQFNQGTLDVQKRSELKKEETYHTYVINESKKYFDGKALEFFLARYFWYKCVEYGSLEKELIVLFKQFDLDYPKSQHSERLRPHIDKIIDYHQAIANPFDPGVLFMDHYETINTLEEAIKPFYGKKIYIDIWASWCGPCKQEFTHNEALKKIVAKEEIQLLYISVDRDYNDQQWKDMIKYYHLTGMHIRANMNLDMDLRKLYHGNPASTISIPQYILVDEKGNMDKYAPRPSQLTQGDHIL